MFDIVGGRPSPLHAALRPSFNVDGCSWNATHVVLVQTTAGEGVVPVVESWKGDLKPGDAIEVPELKPNQNAVAISSYPKPKAAHWFTNGLVS